MQEAPEFGMCSRIFLVEEQFRFAVPLKFSPDLHPNVKLVYI